MDKEIKLFVSGRLCLFGEHSDWAGFYRIINSDIVPGRAIVSGLEQGVYASVTKSEKFIVTSEIEGEEHLSLKCDMKNTALKKIYTKDDYFSYVTGVAGYINEHYLVEGIHIHITKRTLPMKAGLSSSAAICVLVARAFNYMYNLHLNIYGEMQAAYYGEQKTMSRCGRLDQACAFGIGPVSMTFDGNEINVEKINVKKPIHWVFASLMAKKNTIKILSDLNSQYPFMKTKEDKSLYDALGSDNEKIIEKAIKYMEEGKVEKLGQLMTDAQENFDQKIAPYSKEELKSPILHKVLNDPYIKNLTYGGKGVGSQGDGSVQFIAKDIESQKKLITYLEEELKMKSYKTTFKPVNTIKKAIIPVAGFGIRMYPATCAIRKEFFPVVDQDGLTKPIILILLEELHYAGIEEICLIVGDVKTKKFYQEFFQNKKSQEFLDKLPKHMRKYEEVINQIGKKINYVIQKEKKGFGHAVYQAYTFTEKEPVVLLLGDTIYQTKNNHSCIKQLLNAYDEVSKTVVAIHSVPLKDVGTYGIIKGEWTDKDKKIMTITDMKEKPTIEYAKDLLTIDNDAHYYGVFGQYILTNEVFEVLKKHIDVDNTIHGEIQLTDAIKEVADKNGAYAYRTDGKMYDLGNPVAYKKAIRKF